MKKIKNKVLVIIAALLVLSMTLIPFALAKPWENPKNNDKFQIFSSTHTPNIFPILNAEKDYKPSEEDPNVIVVSWEEEMVECDITVGGWTYSLDKDFEYEGYSKWTAIGAPFVTILGLPRGSKSNHWRVEYKYDFSAVTGGIDGTLEMLMVYNNGITSIRSLRGTGHLRNVQIMATAVLGVHEGIVIGWPDIPPAPL